MINLELLYSLFIQVVSKVTPPKRYRDSYHAPSYGAYWAMVQYDRKMRKRTHLSTRHLNRELVRMFNRFLKRSTLPSNFVTLMNSYLLPQYLRTINSKNEFVTVDDVCSYVIRMATLYNSIVATDHTLSKYDIPIILYRMSRTH